MKKTMLTDYPEIVKEWNYEKNEDKKPSDYTYGSSKKVWWIDKYGHEWKVSIANRTMNNTKCPYCTNRKLLVGFNDLATKRPDIAQEWNYMKNKNKYPSDYTYTSKEKVWWIDKYGHEWKTKIVDRTRLNHKCPYCTNRKLLVGFNDLATKYPDIAKEWNYKKNGDKKPSDYSYGSPEKVWWIDKYGHKWKTEIRNRTLKKHNCPICAHRKSLSPEKIKYLKNRYNKITKEWNYKKNGGKKPSDYTYGSSEKIWWIDKYGHEWKAAISSRTMHNTNCPYCAGRKVFIGFNDLASKYPDVAKEWNYEKNNGLKPTDLVFASKKKVWWIDKYGHEWPAIVRSRTVYNQGCPYCAGQKVLPGFNDLATKRPDIAKEWNYKKNKELKPTDCNAGSRKSVWWIDKYGHEWKAAILNRTSANSGCPYCSNDKLLVGFNDLATKYPEIAKEWNYKKNKELKPTDLTYSSIEKVWWIDEYGHEWKIAPYYRTIDNKNCPYCSGKKVLAGYNDLASLYKELSKKICVKENIIIGISPNKISPNSSNLCWWLCEKCGAKYLYRANDMVKAYKRKFVTCPKCKSMSNSKIHFY